MPAHQSADVASTSTTPTSAPEIAIISPTPRTFTFPIDCTFPPHSLSPIESPSSSPFEPDLSPLSFIPYPNPLTPPPQLSNGRALSPAHRARLQARSHSYSPSRSHSRAGQHILSSTSLPKKGDADYVKRPENAFILFRRKCCEERQEEEAAIKAGKLNRKPRQADLSKSISQQWKSLTSAERQHWEDLAKEKKKEHEEMYPDYVYRPQRARDKDGNVKPRKPRGSRFKEKSAKSVRRESSAAPSIPEESSSHLNITLPTLPEGMRPYGRSMSLPTPREMVEFPNVYGNFPMNPARAGAPGYEHQVCDDSAPIDWAAMRGEGLMPWGVNWGVTIQMPELMPTYFPNPEYTFEPGAVPLHFSPSMSSDSSQSSLPSLPPFELPLEHPQFSSCDLFGMDIEVDFSTQPLGYASMAWENSNQAWGPNAMVPVPDHESFSSTSHVNTHLPQWGAGAIPPLELGLPQPSLNEDDVTPTGELEARLE